MGREDLGAGPLGTVGNVIWLILVGWWLALAHLVTAIGLAITIIGIPFAWAHLKMIPLASSGSDVRRGATSAHSLSETDTACGRSLHSP
jgi:uncharacterized membrane protein YccF (DUF307 family)